MLIDNAQLLAEVRDCAAELVRSLCAAEQETAGWQDAEATRRLVRGALQTCLDRLSQTGCWGEANRLPSGELWTAAADWLQHGQLQHRARFKPLGYAGDYQMLAMICDGYRCSHPLGQAFDDFFQREAAPQAVRNRTRLVAEQIVERARARRDGRLKAASIGSGPACDLRSAAEQLEANQRNRLEVRLVDIDPAALDFARSQLAPLLRSEQITTVRANLFRLARQRQAIDALAGADLVICTGLFDYLSFGDAAGLLKLLYDRLAPGGRLLAFNFAPHNSSRAYMEWIGNWYLIYRDCKDLRELAQAAGIGDNRFVVDAEALGVNLLLQAEKPPGQ